MQILEIDWQQFLEVLPSFQELPQEARRLFLEKVRPSQPIPNAELGEQREVLLASGFLLSGPKGKNAAVPPRLRAFYRVMRSLYRHRIFVSPSRQAFQVYLAEHFSGSERGAFCRLSGNYYGEWDLYSRVCSIDWLKRFLAADERSWEEKYSDVRGQRNFFSPGVFRFTQKLVRSFLGRATPVPLVELSGLCPDATPALLAASLLAATRYLLFFLSLRSDDMEPVLGIWPGITKKLFRVPAKPPGTVTPHQVFHAPFLMDDIASLLATCAAEPLRVRSYDFGLFARAERQIASVLGTLPEWVERDLRAGLPERIAMALSFSKHHSFLEDKGRPGQDLRLEVTEAAGCWLRLPAKERLKTLLDGLLGTLKKPSELFDYEEEATSLLPYPLETIPGEESAENRAAVIAPYTGPDVDTFVSLREFLAYHRERSNPLLSAVRRSSNARLWVRGTYVTTADSEELEEAWAGVLEDFLRLRLLPLGAVKVGLHGDGAVCFAVTEAGQYLVGVRPDFEFEQASGEIVVQPNFDVVFLAAAPRAESEIARFAERNGRHMGTLFRITKQSILAAAAAGLTRDQVFETLRQCCSGELPPNVEREISGWFAQCRRVSLRPAVLIQCQDSDTADRVLAAAGNKATRITDTTLELHDGDAQSSLLRKLREIGIFVRS